MSYVFLNLKICMTLNLTLILINESSQNKLLTKIYEENLDIKTKIQFELQRVSKSSKERNLKDMRNRGECPLEVTNYGNIKMS